MQTAPMLSFSPDQPLQTVFVQLDEANLESFLQEGGWLKGGQEGKAYFCTEDYSYVVKTTGTTNTRLLIAKGEWEVLAEAPSHLELSVAPPFAATSLLPLLQEADGREFSEEDRAAKGCYGRAQTTYDLAASSQAACMPLSALFLMQAEGVQALLQASTREVEAALGALGAVCLDHRWFTMTQTFQAQCTEILLLTLTQHGWPLHAVPAGELCQSMQEDGFLPGATAFCASKLSEEGCLLSADVWKLDAAKVAAIQGMEEEEKEKQEKPAAPCPPDSLDEIMLDSERLF